MICVKIPMQYFYRDEYSPNPSSTRPEIKRQRDSFAGFMDETDFPIVTDTGSNGRVTEIFRIPLDEGDELEFEIPQMLPDQFYSSQDRRDLKNRRRDRGEVRVRKSVGIQVNQVKENDKRGNKN